MKTTLAAIIILAATITAGCSESRLSVVASAATDGAGRIERGKHLVHMIGCSDCHTPFKMGPKGPEPDMDRFLSGHPEQIGPLQAPAPTGQWISSTFATNTAFSGPWGISYTANLTPDQNTGLGIWTEDMFMKAIRTGRHMGVSREILPPMPWPSFRNATDEDLKSIYAYLRSIKPIVNHVPDVTPPAAAVVQ
jgi:hypothetical protein